MLHEYLTMYETLAMYKTFAMNKTFTMNKTFFEKIISIILLFDVIVHWSTMNKIFWISSKISNRKILDEKISSYLSANKWLFAQKCWQNLLTSSSDSLNADRATRLLDLNKFQYKTHLHIHQSFLLCFRVWWLK